MVVTESTDRECCDPYRDLNPYCPITEDESKIKYTGGRFKYHFCVHCGQLWTTERHMDASGNGYETDWVRVDRKI